MTEYLQALILTFIEALCCTIFFNTFFERRFAKTQHTLDKLLFCILCMLFMGIAVISDDNYIIKAIAAIMIICGVMMGMYKGKWLQILFMSVIYYGFVLLIDRVVFIFVLYAMNIGEKEFWHNPIRATIISILAKNVLFLCILFLKRKFKEVGGFALITDREWIRFLFFPLVSIVCMITFAVKREAMGSDVLVVSFGLIFLNFLLFFMIQDIVKHESEKQEMRLSQERTKNQIAMYEYMEEIYDEQRKQLHDFKNHMACLQGLIKDKAYTQANEYLRTLNDDWVDEIDCINTNHAIVNSVLNQKYKLARKKGIAMILSVNDLQGITLKDEDIVTLLSNLLDNAIEACEKVTKQPKNIHVRIWREDNYIYISTKNPVDEPVRFQNGKIRTTKKNERFHGIGLSNIKNVVERYNGEDICSCQNGYFTHSIVIEKNVGTVVL